MVPLKATTTSEGAVDEAVFRGSKRGGDGEGDMAGEKVEGWSAQGRPSPNYMSSSCSLHPCFHTNRQSTSRRPSQVAPACLGFSLTSPQPPLTFSDVRLPEWERRALRDLFSQIE